MNKNIIFKKSRIFSNKYLIIDTSDIFYNDKIYISVDLLKHLKSNNFSTESINDYFIDKKIDSNYFKKLLELFQ